MGCGGVMDGPKLDKREYLTGGKELVSIKVPCWNTEFMFGILILSHGSLINVVEARGQARWLEAMLHSAK